LLKEYLKVMKALADRNRTKIIKMLSQKEMCVCEMQSVLKMAQPSVSKHLKILEEASLVESRKEGLWVNYRLHTNPDNIYATHMLEVLGDWINDEAEITDVVNLAGTADRCNITGSCR
jgi:ArsR family transcriptional regulator